MEATRLKFILEELRSVLFDAAMGYSSEKQKFAMQLYLKLEEQLNREELTREQIDSLPLGEL